jgi:hypothetical protein
MKRIVSLAILLLAPIAIAAPQTSSAEPALQGSNNTHSRSGKVASHDRHARKHHTSNQHHRHRTTAKNHTS